MPGLSIQQRIAFLFGLMASLVLVFVVAALLLSYRGWLNAGRMVEHNHIASHTLEAVKHFAFERGRTNVVLKGNATISAKNRAFIDERRAKADAAIRAATTAARGRFPRETEALGQSWERVAAARAEVERDFARPPGERDGGLPRRWLDAANELVDRLEQLLILASRVEGADFNFARLAGLRLHALQFRNTAGNESTLLGGELSAARIPDARTLLDAARLRGDAQRTWSYIEQSGRGLADPRIDAAIAKVRDRFFNGLRPLEDRMIGAARQMKAVDFPVETYTQTSVPALDSIIEMVDSIDLATREHASRQLELAGFWLAVSAGGLLLLIGVLLMARRDLASHLTRPLQSILTRIQALGGPDKAGAVGKHADLTAIDHALDLLEKSQAELVIARRNDESRLATEEKLRHLYELSPLGIALTDMRGRYVEFNEAFRLICGYTADELKALDYWALTPRKFEAEEARQLEQLRLRGRYGPYEKEYVRKDGSHVPLRLNGVRVTGADGEQYIWSIVEDISERHAHQQRLEQLLAEQRAMLENDLVGIVRIRNRVVTWTNPAFEKVFGHGGGAMRGMPTRDLFANEADYRELGERAYLRMAAGEIYRSQLELVRRDGGHIWADLSGAMLDKESMEFLWAFIDITDRKRTEDALIEAKEAAEAANIAKSRFLATMSHELRTPMNGVLGMAQLLLMPGLEDSERQEYARVILNSGQTLLTLLNDILDLSKIEAGKVELQISVFQPLQLIRETAALFDEATGSKGLRLETAWEGAADVRYHADSNRLRQMLSNFVGNAVKFTPAGCIRIEGREVENLGDESLLEFAVVDSGIGIPEDKQALLFKPFSQVDASTTREYGGTGLGLSIVRNLALLMNGDIGVHSEPGKGSRFWFRVRLRHVGESDDSRGARRSAALPRAHGDTPRVVLVVEDHATNRRVIEAMLAQEGWRCESVENGEEALARIVAGMRPDLVLMDCLMPVLDGYEATRRIRAWEQRNGQPRLPIVALTASAYEEDRQRCLAVGMDDFLTKPLDVRELSVVLEKWGKAAAGGPPRTD